MLKKTNRDFKDILGYLKPQLELYLNSTFKWIETDYYYLIPLVFTGNMKPEEKYESFSIRANLEADDMRNITTVF